LGKTCFWQVKVPLIKTTKWNRQAFCFLKKAAMWQSKKQRKTAMTCWQFCFCRNKVWSMKQKMYRMSAKWVASKNSVASGVVLSAYTTAVNDTCHNVQSLLYGGYISYNAQYKMRHNMKSKSCIYYLHVFL